MNKEEFEQQILECVTYYRDKLEVNELNRAMLPDGVLDSVAKVANNPFFRFEAKYFNSKILSNIEGLNKVVCSNSELTPNQITLLIISNPRFKVLNQIIKHNQYLVYELKEQTRTPMDIAIEYAKYCEMQDKYQSALKR